MKSYIGAFKGKDWLETQSWSQEDLKLLIDAAKDLKQKYKAHKSTAEILHDRTLFMIFFNRSLRTRNSFEAGMTQLGGHAHFLSPQDIYVPALPEDEEAYKTERISDVAAFWTKWEMQSQSESTAILRNGCTDEDIELWKNLPDGQKYQ